MLTADSLRSVDDHTEATARQRVLRMIGRVAAAAFLAALTAARPHRRRLADRARGGPESLLLDEGDLGASGHAAGTSARPPRC